MSKRLEGRVVIVTGAGSGIGRASAQLFAEHGASVLASDVTDAVEETVALVRDAGGNALAVKSDASDEAQVKGLIDQAVSDLGGLDGLYANAGISGGWFPITDATVEDFQRTLNVNLIGPFLAIKHAVPVMAKQGRGSIVCTASVAGLRANAGPIAYSASKAGVISLVQTTATQLRGSGIRINAICPGLIETGMTKPIFDMARARGSEGRIGQLSALARYGEPHEIAHMALFLLSDEASYVNGQAIAVDGGLSSTHPFIPPKQPRSTQG